jgi:hypothetical protein
MTVRLYRATRLLLEGFFNEIYLSISLKYVEEIQVSFNDAKNNDFFTRKTRYMYDRLSILKADSLKLHCG